MARTAYILETKQMYGEWLSHTFDKKIYSLSAAKEKAIADEQHYHCPKRVVNAATGEVLFTVGDTPEHEAFMARVRARIEARENPSEQFNRPTAWESRLNTWNNNITHPNHFSLDSEYAWELVDFLSERTPAYGQYRYGHELAASDWLGCYMMGEEI